MGVPSSSKNCLLLLFAAAPALDMRVPNPAAGMMTMTFMLGSAV